MKWSSNFAYALGLLTTDGNLSKDGRHFDFTSKDLDQVQNFAKALGLRNKIGLKSSSYGRSKNYHRIQFGDVKLYRFLVSIGLHPNKSKTLAELTIPDKYFVDFLRGYLDGDGFTHSYWDKRWKSSFRLYTGFVSASKRHLVWIETKIKRLYGISGTINTSGNSAYQLMYAKRNSLILINKLYYNDKILFLKRKRFKIEQALGIIRGQAGML